MLEEDLHIPEHFHNALKEFPPCPEIVEPEEHMFSNSQNHIMKQKHTKTNKNNVKFVPHLMDTHNYCIHYRNLKYVIDLGVQVARVHNIIIFMQKTWLQQHIYIYIYRF